jgi:hypothetical protein
MKSNKTVIYDSATVDRYYSHYGVKSEHKLKKWLRTVFWKFHIHHMLTL